MAQTQAAAGRDPTQGDPLTLARLGRIILFFVSFGFLYPKALVEGMDLSALQAKTEGNLYKK